MSGEVYRGEVNASISFSPSHASPLLASTKVHGS